MPPTINPANFRGFSRDPIEFEGLLDQEFVSRCPPDLQPNTRIIAVCGVSDTKGCADPFVDGWFLSDFYLFHYLLRPSGKWLVFLCLYICCFRKLMQVN